MANSFQNELNLCNISLRCFNNTTGGLVLDIEVRTQRQKLDLRHKRIDRRLCMYFFFWCIIIRKLWYLGNNQKQPKRNLMDPNWKNLRIICEGSVCIIICKIGLDLYCIIMFFSCSGMKCYESFNPSKLYWLADLKLPSPFLCTASNISVDHFFRTDEAGNQNHLLLCSFLKCRLLNNRESSPQTDIK